MPPAPLVLIAEDNVDTREMYAAYLDMLGYRVETAADGHEALYKVRSTRPDIVVMDLNMPRIDGLAAIAQLRNDPETAAIPVVVITGHELKTFLKRAVLAVGAASYLMKPVLPERLAAEVTERLRAPRTGTASGI
jgi:hypothetical protein